MEWELVEDEVYKKIDNMGMLPLYEMTIDMAPLELPSLNRFISNRAIVKFRYSPKEMKEVAYLKGLDISKYKTIGNFLVYIFNLLADSAKDLANNPTGANLEGFKRAVEKEAIIIESIEYKK